MNFGNSEVLDTKVVLWQSSKGDLFILFRNYNIKFLHSSLSFRQSFKNDMCLPWFLKFKEIDLFLIDWNSFLKRTFADITMSIFKGMFKTLCFLSWSSFLIFICPTEETLEMNSFYTTFAEASQLETLFPFLPKADSTLLLLFFIIFWIHFLFLIFLARQRLFKLSGRWFASLQFYHFKVEKSSFDNSAYFQTIPFKNFITICYFQTFHRQIGTIFSRFISKLKIFLRVFITQTQNIVRLLPNVRVFFLQTNITDILIVIP